MGGDRASFLPSSPFLGYVLHVNQIIEPCRQTDLFDHRTSFAILQFLVYALFSSSMKNSAAVNDYT